MRDFLTMRPKQKADFKQDSMFRRKQHGVQCSAVVHVRHKRTLTGHSTNHCAHGGQS